MSRSLKEANFTNDGNLYPFNISVYFDEININGGFRWNFVGTYFSLFFFGRHLFYRCSLSIYLFFFHPKKSQKS